MITRSSLCNSTLACFSLLHTNSDLPITWRVQAYPDSTVNPGDTISFTWAGNHNVYLMPNEDAFNNCDFSDALQIGTASPHVYSSAGTVPGQNLYFACSAGSHCTNGQKLKVTAVAAAPDTEGPSSKPTPEVCVCFLGNSAIVLFLITYAL